MAEFELITRIRQRAATRDDVILGIGDDAALLQPPTGHQLVVAMDTLNAGVHFPRATAAADIGWKALAVNLSDLAAMGAEPAWCTLSLSLPESDEDWLDGFLDGFLELAAQHRVALVGGDTTRGPLSVCVTVHGFVEPGRALRRDAARVGDTVWVSGTLGDAAAALALLESGAIPAVDTLRQRLDRPTPRIALGRALSGLAHACIDVSDGLLADLDHVCEASGVGMRIALDRLPASDALGTACDDDARASFQASGGDDYELAFTAPTATDGEILAAAANAGVPVSRVGEVVVGERVRAFAADGCEWQPRHRGHIHFDG
ncbi:thiamine-phosphate kinase [Marilutibacter alkalisoli]|uniref:Thiamine-monophosphate kinase n=1 Tax=Marilutibacter alkalisoli TaxID=2591633 RepID=A0A514BUA6_9GAMM|nr:thiamine-phosphate kinase [Lysobacter alkalisoli]QDH70970.1 thiamine-phosphate kinase [Lysobacter alkalisoli]